MPSHSSYGLLPFNVFSVVAIVSILLISTQTSAASLSCDIKNFITEFKLKNENDLTVKKLRVIESYPNRCPYGFRLILTKIDIDKEKTKDMTLEELEKGKEDEGLWVDYLKCKEIGKGTEKAWFIKLREYFDVGEYQLDGLETSRFGKNPILKCKKYREVPPRKPDIDQSSVQADHDEMQKELSSMKIAAYFVAAIPCLILFVTQCIFLHGYGRIKQLFAKKKKVVEEPSNEELVRDGKKEKTVVDVNEVDKQTQIGGETQAV